MSFLFRVFITLFFFGTSLFTNASPIQEPKIAAAADLKFALTEILSQFTKETGKKIDVTFGASGELEKQIDRGAHYELFLSANENYTRQLANESWGTHHLDYARGQLAVFIPNQIPGKFNSLKSFVDAVNQGKINKVVIANPKLAPYGRAAKEAIINLHWRPLVQSKLVIASDTYRAMEMVLNGRKQAGIVPLSLLVATPFSSKGSYVIIPNHFYSKVPLKQSMILSNKASNSVQAFYQYMQQPKAKAILKKHGFAVDF